MSGGDPDTEYFPPTESTTAADFCRGFMIFVLILLFFGSAKFILKSIESRRVADAKAASPLEGEARLGTPVAPVPETSRYSHLEGTLWQMEDLGIGTYELDEFVLGRLQGSYSRITREPTEFDIKEFILCCQTIRHFKIASPGVVGLLRYIAVTPRDSPDDFYSLQAIETLGNLGPAASRAILLLSANLESVQRDIAQTAAVGDEAIAAQTQQRRREAVLLKAIARILEADEI